MSQNIYIYIKRAIQQQQNQPERWLVIDELHMHYAAADVIVGGAQVAVQQQCARAGATSR